MTRSSKIKQARERQARPARESRLPRGLVVLGAVAAVAAFVGVVAWRAGDDGEKAFTGAAASDPGPVHVHGLGIDPADGALFVATHTGLYRAGDGQRKAQRVADRYQDTMGFTVVGPNRFLGSGHPDLNEARTQGLPARLGLIESTDAGASWRSVSLRGEADFHVLRFVDPRVYGYDASSDRLLVSSDRGRTWDELEKPGPVVDLAVDPGNAKRIVVASAGGPAHGLFESRDGGHGWTRTNDAVGLLGWPARDRLYLVTGGGQTFASSDAGRVFEKRGEIGGEPAAFLAHAPDELYVALHDGTIERSADGGASWTVRSTP
jgi:hypothetical protein